MFVAVVAFATSQLRETTVRYPAVVMSALWDKSPKTPVPLGGLYQTESSAIAAVNAVFIIVSHLFDNFLIFVWTKYVWSSC